MPLELATWNVLHRTHAENWSEPAVERYPDEALRCAAVLNTVQQQLASGCSVVCLQEVSGDMLATLRASLDPSVRVFTHRYARTPRLRVEAGTTLRDPSEQLVTLVSRHEATLASEGDSPKDPGKGHLAVRVYNHGHNHWTVLNAHVAYDASGPAQIAALASLASAFDGRVVALGDFNTHLAAVRAAFDPSFALADLSQQSPTRVGFGKSPPRWIDHVAVRGATIARSHVHDVALQSDHNLVRATLVELTPP